MFEEWWRWSLFVRMKRKMEKGKEKEAEVDIFWGGDW